MDISQTLDALAEVLAAAKPRALGGGAIVDRDTAMQLLEQARAVLPDEIRQAQGILAERDAVIEDARIAADELRAAGQAEAAALIQDSPITAGARAEGERIVLEATAEADRKRAEVDAYVDAKLASFEGTLLRTIEAVQNGRQKLAGAYADDTPVR